MADAFLKAFRFTMENEGGYVEDENDPGGATNFGISKEFLKKVYAKGVKEADINGNGMIDTRDIKGIGYGLVQKLYREEFWEKIKAIPNENIAIKVFDASVNIGPNKAIKILQQVVNTTPDGIIGPLTIKAIQKINNTSKVLEAFITGLKLYYYDLVRRNKELQKFLQGWIVRADRIPK